MAGRLTRAAVSGVAVGVGVVAERRRRRGDGQGGVLAGCRRVVGDRGVVDGAATVMSRWRRCGAAVAVGDGVGEGVGAGEVGVGV